MSNTPTDHQLLVVTGCAAIVLGSWLLRQAYEEKGKKRPWGLSWLPGA